MNMPETVFSARLVLERPHPPTPALAGEIFAAIDRSRATLCVWLPFFDAIRRPEDELRFLEDPCARGWESGRVFPYSIRLVSTREFAGVVSLENVSDRDRSAEIGYWLDGILRQNRWLSAESRYADSNVFSRLSTDP